MRSRYFLASCISLVLMTPILAQSSGGARVNKPQTATSRPPIFMPAAGLKWIHLYSKGAPGVKVADLWAITPRGHSARSSSCRQDLPRRFTRTLTT